MRIAREGRIALAGGGSGGHLFPGLALAGTILGADDRPVLYGSGRAGEERWAGDGVRRVALDAPHLPSRGRDVPGFVVRLARAISASLREMHVRRPELVVGLGGYASVAPGIAALISGRPLLLLEQNVVPGKANRLLARLGGRVAASYEESLAHLPAQARRRSRFLGNPVRPSLFGGRRAPERFSLDPGRPILLEMGGSQGAKGLNSGIALAAPVLAARGVQVIALTGVADEERVRAAFSDAGVRSFVASFLDDMATAYATADLVLCRAGGTTLAELSALGRPSVLVPYPHHRDRHQERNAAVTSAVGAARVVPESELTPDRVEREVVDLIGDPGALAAMGRAAARLGVPDAARRVAVFAAELMREAGHR